MRFYGSGESFAYIRRATSCRTPNPPRERVSKSMAYQTFYLISILHQGTLRVVRYRKRNTERIAPIRDFHTPALHRQYALNDLPIRRTGQLGAFHNFHLRHLPECGQPLRIEIANPSQRAKIQLAVCRPANRVLDKVPRRNAVLVIIILEPARFLIPAGNAIIGTQPQIPVQVLHHGPHENILQALFITVMLHVFRKSRVRDIAQPVAGSRLDATPLVHKQTVDSIPAIHVRQNTKLRPDMAYKIHAAAIMAYPNIPKRILEQAARIAGRQAMRRTPHINTAETYLILIFKSNPA